MCEALKRIRSGRVIPFYHMVGKAISDIDSRNNGISDKMNGKHSSELISYDGEERRKSARQ